MPSCVKTLLATLGGLAVAVITVLTTFSIVSWSAAQTALVTAEAGAIIGLATALVAHFWPGTQQEPVAVAATFTATISATMALGTGFGWWSLTTDQTGALVGVVSAVIGVLTAVLARNQVQAKTTAGAGGAGATRVG